MGGGWVTGLSVLFQSELGNPAVCVAPTRAGDDLIAWQMAWAGDRATLGSDPSADPGAKTGGRAAAHALVEHRTLASESWRGSVSFQTPRLDPKTVLARSNLGEECLSCLLAGAHGDLALYLLTTVWAGNSGLLSIDDGIEFVLDDLSTNCVPQAEGQASGERFSALPVVRLLSSWITG